MKIVIPKRVKVFLLEYAICSFLILLSMIVITRHLVVAFVFWFLAHAGPFLWLGTRYAYDRQTLNVIIVTGVLCITAYLMRPNKVTAVITFVGLACWFYMAIYCWMMGI